MLSHTAKLWALALVACAIATTSAPAVGGSKPLKVTSTLDQKRVLTLRTRWLAYPNKPASQISEVDYLIDGKVRWIEHFAPYNYGSDDFHGHLGYLVTTWLAPGRHTFTARAKAKNGQTATDTVVARVIPAPRPPAALAGKWTRTVTAADLTKAGKEGPPGGRWTLVFDRIGAWHLDPLGSGVVNQYDVAGNALNVYAPIQMAPFGSAGGGVSRFGHHGIGGTDCNYDGPFGSYTWSASGDELTLTAKKEPCGNRRAIWEGIWSRTH
jgi:hypothetical protein